MSVCVAGLWEIGWNTPIKEIEEWQFMLKEFGVDELHMTPVSGIYAGLTQTFLQEHANFEQSLAEHRTAGKTLVFVDENATVALPAFTHPANACYVLGRAGMSPYTAYFNAELGDVCVKVPTLVNQGGFWPHQALALVLYDRMLKQG